MRDIQWKSHFSAIRRAVFRCGIVRQIRSFLPVSACILPSLSRSQMLRYSSSAGNSKPNMEAVVTYQGTAVPITAHSFADLEGQIQAAFPALQRTFRLIARSMYGQVPLDSQFSFQRLPTGSPVHITVIESVLRRTGNGTRTQGVARVRLANLAYLARNGTVRETEDMKVEEVPPEEMCPICMERWKRPMKAKCGHVCCLSCWERALAQYLECPLCRSHVRLKTLRPFPCTAV